MIFLETLRALVEDSDFLVTFGLEPRNSKWPAEKFCCDIEDDQGSDIITGSGPDLLSALNAAASKVRRMGTRT